MRSSSNQDTFLFITNVDLDFILPPMFKCQTLTIGYLKLRKVPKLTHCTGINVAFIEHDFQNLKVEMLPFTIKSAGSLNLQT